MKIISKIVIAAILVLAINSFAKAQVNPQDRQALIDLYNSTDGSNWINSTNWLTDDVSTWFGVTVSDNRVTRIILANNNLNGTIPPSLANLTNLYFLNLGFNNLFDTIPFSLCNLINLQYFFLNVNNNISGVIPPNIGNLTNLIRIDLSFNQLSGTIPSSFSNCLSLQNLYLENNMLTGTIPESLGNLTNLQNVFLDDNQLSGSIPASLSNLTYLPRLWLYDNQFTFSGMEGIVNIAQGSSYGTLNNIYAPQATIPLYNNNNILSVSVGGTPANNTFKWYKDSVLVATKVRDSTYTVTSNGTYWAVATNSVATQLTLYSDTLKIDNFGIPPPTILSFTPNGICPGTSIPVFITGSNFTGATAVTVGGAAVDSFKVNDSSSITAYISKGTTGKIVVTSPNGTTTSDSVFTFGIGHTAYAYITNGGDGTVSVINTQTNKVVDTIIVGNSTSYITTKVDGTKVYVSNSGTSTVSVINTSSNTVTATIPVGRNPDGLCISPDGSKVYVANNGGSTMSVINTASNSVTATIPGLNSPWGVAVSTDGSKVYVTNANGNTLSVIDATSNTIATTVQVGDIPLYVTLNPSGKYIYVGNFGDQTISVIDAATNTITATIPVGNSMYGIAFSPDGTKIYVVNGTNTVTILNAATNTIITSVIVGRFPSGIGVSPDGKELYVSNNGDGTVSIINTVDYSIIATMPVGQNPNSFGNFIANVPTPCGTPPPILPAITSFNTPACPGTIDTIKGSGFTDANVVLFGKDTASSFKVINDSTIVAVVDSGASGSVQVNTPNGNAGLAGFIYLSPTKSTTDTSICKGNFFTFNGKTYDSAGIYRAHLMNSVGCDSTATLLLSINQPTTSTTDTSICQGSSFTFNGINYSSAGSYTTHLINSAGCDSTATLVLTVRNPDTSYTKGSFCKTPYIFNGTSYDSVGTFTAHLTTVAGCDSIAILTLTKDSSQNLLGIGTELNQVCLNQFDTLTDMTLGGTWKSLDPTIASIDSIGTVNGVSVGLVKGLSVGTANITYTISSSCGTETTPPQAIQVIGIKPTVDTIIHNATCINPESGSVALSIIGSEGPYQDSINGNWYTVYDTLTNLGAGSYSIYIKNSLGCMVDTLPDVTISVIDDASCYALYVPTGFVPTTTNPTGATKLLKPFGGSSAIQAITFRVYNRFGGLVFESHDLVSGWDGTINGTLQDTGTYVWMLEYTINNTRKFDKGTSTLIR